MKYTVHTTQNEHHVDSVRLLEWSNDYVKFVNEENQVILLVPAREFISAEKVSHEPDA